MDRARLEELYSNSKARIKELLGLSNIMETPKISKIVLNVGIKNADSKGLQTAMKTLELITGQKPIRTRAKKSIAGFKLREGMIVGTKVTLRRRVMYEFLDRLISFALPKVRDFQGVPTRFDQFGNYNLGLKECSIFPELDAIVMEKSHGLNITIQIDAIEKNHGRVLLQELGMPFAGGKA